MARPGGGGAARLTLMERLYRPAAGEKRAADKSCLAFTPALCAALQVAEGVKLLCGRPTLPPDSLLMADLLHGSFEVISLGKG